MDQSWERSIPGWVLLPSEDSSHCTHAVGAQEYPYSHWPPGQSHQNVQGEDHSWCVWTIQCLISLPLVLCPKEEWLPSACACAAPQWCHNLQHCCSPPGRPICWRHCSTFMLLYAWPPCWLRQSHYQQCLLQPHKFPLPSWHPSQHDTPTGLNEHCGHLPQWCYIHPQAQDPEHC